MQTEALRAFFEAARQRSIRKAGEKLGLAPSSVSRHIRMLERQFGTALVERSARGVGVTHAGERVVTFARSVLGDYDSLRMDLDDYKGGYKALIRVALVEGISAAGPSLAMTRFRARFRDVRFEVTMMSAPQVNEAVRRAEAELGITFGVDTDPEFNAVAVSAEPLIYCARSGTAAGDAARAHVDLRVLAAHPLALPGKTFGIRALIDQAARASGLALDPVLSSNSFEILRDFAASGGGGAVLPARALRGKDVSLLNIATIRDRHLRRTQIEIIVLKGRRLARVLRLFQTELGKAMAEA